MTLFASRRAGSLTSGRVVVLRGCGEEMADKLCSISRMVCVGIDAACGAFFETDLAARGLFFGVDAAIGALSFFFADADGLAGMDAATGADGRDSVLANVST